MKKYTKRQALCILHEAAGNYERYLRGKQFLFAYRFGTDVRFSVVQFSASSFLHLTGMKTNVPANAFYERALHSMLSERDIEFRSGNTHRKLAVLQSIPQITRGPSLIGRYDEGTGFNLMADAVIGNEKPLKLTLAFRGNGRTGYPVSLLCEDVRRISRDPVRVLAVWKRGAGERDFAEATYCSAGEDAEAILSLWREGQLVFT
mgnify:FL=1|jgi:hypothetical protein